MSPRFVRRCGLLRRGLIASVSVVIAFGCAILALVGVGVNRIGKERTPLASRHALNAAAPHE